MSNDNKQGKFDAFLTNETDMSDDVKYIKPNIEMKLSKEKRQACRDIVLEIKQYGITQRQLWFLINLLSLELENQNLVKAIADVIGEHRDSIPIVKTSKTKLILPVPE